MIFVVKEYLKFLIKSTNQHGVHSPFVYNFVVKCLYSEPLQSQKEFYKRYKSRLLESKDKILVNDFGAGSKVFNNNLRKISKIAKVASIREKYGLLIMRFVPYLNIRNSLEIGTSLGVASSCLGFADDKLKVLTLEGCENTAHVAKEQFEFFGLKNIEVLVGEFEKTLPQSIENNSFDLIFFDGNHTKEATVNYFKAALSSRHNDSVFIFDDIHWNTEMCAAWQEIKNHEEVTVTIDTFQWGIVFFRKEQKKEHFTIRI